MQALSTVATSPLKMAQNWLSGAETGKKGAWFLISDCAPYDLPHGMVCLPEWHRGLFQKRAQTDTNRCQHPPPRLFRFSRITFRAAFPLMGKGRNPPVNRSSPLWVLSDLEGGWVRTRLAEH